MRCAMPCCTVKEQRQRLAWLQPDEMCEMKGLTLAIPRLHLPQRVRGWAVKQRHLPGDQWSTRGQMRHPRHLQENSRWRVLGHRWRKLPLRRGELGVLWGAFGTYHWQLGVRVSHLTITNVSPVKVKVCRPWRRRRPDRVEPASAVFGMAIEASGSCHGREQCSYQLQWFLRLFFGSFAPFRRFDTEGEEGGGRLN